MFPELHYVFLDTEGTSRSKSENDLIEFSLLSGTLETLASPVTSLVKPTHKIPPIVAKLTGITNEAVAQAPTFATLVPHLRSVLKESCLVGHNVQCDINLINQNLAAIQEPPLTNPWLDTQTVAQCLDPEAQRYTLSYLKNYRNIPVKSSHRATADAYTTWHLLRQYSLQLQAAPPVFIQTACRLISQLTHPMLWQFIHAHYTIASRKPYTHYLNGYQGVKRLDATPPTAASIRQIFQHLNTQPGYTHRKTQVQMATLCQNALQSNRHAVLESPTGTGKSLAYLIPAIIHAVRKNAPVIIVTKTKALQDQLMETLDNLVDLGLPAFSYTLIKGRQNYMSTDRFDALLRRYLQGATRKQVIGFLGVFYWLLNTKTGDLSELNPGLHRQFYQAICYEPDLPLAGGALCFLSSLRQQVKSVDLIITNHAFFFSDQHNNTQILPTPSGIIIDEAHALEASVQSQFTYTLALSEFKAYKTLMPIAGILGGVLVQSAGDITPVVKRYLNALCDEAERLLTPQTTPNDSPPDRVLIGLHRTALAFKVLPTHYTQWVTETESSVIWHAAPVACAACVKPLITTDIPIIFTSATLSVGTSFQYFLETIGLDNHIETHQLPPVFDYQTQARAYWGEPGYTDADLYRFLKTNQDKNSLILFTAFESLKQFYQHRPPGLQIIAHRIHGDYNAVLNRFRNARKPAVLLGLDTFWEGLDLPGNQVSTVIIYKLPFLPPSDPVVAAKLVAMATAGQNGFMQYTLPHAVIRFKQGIGRLIRRTTDSGILIIWDHRIKSKSYGRAFLKALSNWPCESIRVLFNALQNSA